MNSKLPVPASKLSDDSRTRGRTAAETLYQSAYLQRTHQLHPEKSVKHFGRGIYELLRVEYNEQIPLRLKTLRDLTQREPKTMHHQGIGRFVVEARQSS